VSRAGRLIPGERAGSYQRVRVADIGPVATEHRPSTSPVRRLPSLSRPRHRRECPLRRGHSPKGIFSMLRGAPGCFAVPLAASRCPWPLSFALPIIQIIRGTILLRWTTPPTLTSQQQNRKRKSKGSKRGQEHVKSSQSLSGIMRQHRAVRERRRRGPW
jgi:hypothetical protein